MAATLLWASLAGAQPLARGSAAFTLAPSIDTNPLRTVGADSETDGLLAGTASGKGRLVFDGRHALTGRYDAGFKKFALTTGEDLLVQEGGVGYAAQLERLVLGLDAGAKLRRTRAADRDYSDLWAEGSADLQLTQAFAGRVAFGARRYLYPPDHGYSSTGPTASLQLRYVANRQHAFAVTGTFSPRSYRAPVRLSDGSLGSEERADRWTGAGLTWQFRGPIALQAGYAYLRQQSNSFGESTDRHRLYGALTVKLPAELYAMAQGAFQFIRYPDGIFLARDFLLFDDEAQSSLGFKLARPVAGPVDLELRYAVYYIRLPKDEDALLRQTLGLGLAARL